MNAETPPERGHGRTGTGRSASYTVGPREFDIPAHRLHPAEANMRFFVNTIRREPHHWWLRTPQGRSQLEFIHRRDAA